VLGFEEVNILGHSLDPARSPPFYIETQFFCFCHQTYCSNVNYEGNTLSNGIKYAAGEMVNILLNKSPIFDARSRTVARALPPSFFTFPLFKIPIFTWAFCHFLRMSCWKKCQDYVVSNCSMKLINLSKGPVIGNVPGGVPKSRGGVYDFLPGN